MGCYLCVGLEAGNDAKYFLRQRGRLLGLSSDTGFSRFDNRKRSLMSMPFRNKRCAIPHILLGLSTGLIIIFGLVLLDAELPVVALGPSFVIGFYRVVYGRNGAEST